jgi:hypothetical protein
LIFFNIIHSVAIYKVDSGHSVYVYL